MLYSEDPLPGNESAGDVYSHIVEDVVNKLAKDLKRFKNKPLEEPWFVGFVIAISELTSLAPGWFKTSSPRLTRLREEYIAWWEKFGAKVKVKKGVRREEVHKRTLLEFDRAIHISGMNDPEPAKTPCSVRIRRKYGG
ncbi:MAG: hypothetical protein KDA88_01095 [Planctomycetaceae bacterium]|nr:hypothetical protein [Planctomycetaceae bacterium]MCB9950777.1 hypothetical protein [Planctomycetaceae bacterium]